MDRTVPVATIGFTRTSAERFFKRLAEADVRTVIDVRLHNTSQLAGFAKAEDLAFFLGRVAGIAYRHEPSLAPTDAMLKAYRKGDADWPAYERRFLDLMAERKIEERMRPEHFRGACLLCSEPTAHRCHRRLVVEYLNAKWGGALDVRHL